MLELTALRDRLKAKLSASGRDNGESEGPTTGELTERIKALRAENTVEATPQRSERKQSTAEEPITARIRRRQEEAASADETTSPEVLSPEPKAITFPEHILRERQQRAEGERQSPS